MLQLENNPLFRKWTDPLSGIDSYLLSAKPAPLVQSFYFVNSPVTDDGRYLWFYCGFPPSGDR